MNVNSGYFFATIQVNPVVDVATLSIMCTGTVLKSILYFFCRRQKTTGSKILAMDQRNDVVTNVVALIAAYIGHRWWKYTDPIGAVCVW